MTIPGIEIVVTCDSCGSNVDHYVNMEKKGEPINRPGSNVQMQKYECPDCGTEVTVVVRTVS